MNFANCAIILTVLSAFKPSLCENDPIECQIIVDRGKGFAFCQFSQVTGADKDTTKVKVLKTEFQGRIVESERVTAIMIAYSDFDHIPSSVFTNFGNISRIKVFGGTVKSIKKESFEHASFLQYLEIFEVKIDEITSNAFDGANDLEEITLEKCEIGSVATDAFEGLTKLKKLILTDSTFPDDRFLKKLPKKVKIVRQ